VNLEENEFDYLLTTTIFFGNSTTFAYETIHFFRLYPKLYTEKKIIHKKLTVDVDGGIEYEED